MRRLIVLVIFLQAAVAGAQDRRWEVEGAAGVLVAQPASAGSVTLPPPGPPIVTSLPTFPSRAVPSWFFGDGAALLNGVLSDLGPSARIAPLDPIFAPVPAAHPAAIALRVRRWLSPRTAFEVSVDGFLASTVTVDSLAATVDKAGGSFIGAFGALFATGPFTPPAVTATDGTSAGPHGDTAITAAINRDIGRLGPLHPYVTFGGGVVIPQKSVFGATATGRYTTTVVGEVPIQETDSVSIGITRATAFTAVAGGGVRHDLSPRWVVRVDARMLVGPDSTRIHLDATPSVTRGTPSGFIESFTNPAIQFSNDPATGRVSSLSGTPISGLEVFKGGWIARTIIGASVALRF